MFSFQTRRFNKSRSKTQAPLLEFLTLYIPPYSLLSYFAVPHEPHSQTTIRIYH